MSKILIKKLTVQDVKQSQDYSELREVPAEKALQDPESRCLHKFSAPGNSPIRSPIPSVKNWEGPEILAYF